VIPPKNVSGAMSPATREELDLITEWMIEFSKQLGDQNPAHRDDVEERFNAGHYFLWRDRGQVVSIAAFAGPTPNGVRINSVFTPIEFRNQGYASANVAALTQHLLDTGRKLVFLFTDLKNPISNSIYQKVGYRPVCDFNDYRFA
jgi:predicted GNAT family acetyltransferase